MPLQPDQQRQQVRQPVSFSTDLHGNCQRIDPTAPVVRLLEPRRAGQRWAELNRRPTHRRTRGCHLPPLHRLAGLVLQVDGEITLRRQPTAAVTRVTVAMARESSTLPSIRSTSSDPAMPPGPARAWPGISTASATLTRASTPGNVDRSCNTSPRKHHRECRLPPQRRTAQARPGSRPPPQHQPTQASPRMSVASADLVALVLRRQANRCGATACQPAEHDMETVVAHPRACSATVRHRAP